MATTCSSVVPTVKMAAMCSSVVPTVKSEEQWVNACPPWFPHSYAVQYPLPREGCCPCSRCIFPHQWTQLTESLQGMTTVQSNLEKTLLRFWSQEISHCVILTKWTITIIIITIKIIIFVHVGIQVQKVANFWGVRSVTSHIDQMSENLSYHSE